MKKTKVLLDSNALFMPFQFGINIENELNRLIGDCEILIPTVVVDELNKMKNKKHLKSALKLCSKYNTIRCESARTVDESVYLLAIKNNAIVVTNDKELTLKIIRAGGRVVSLRGKSHLELYPAYKT